MSQNGWKPLLDGETATQTREAIAAIAADLKQNPPQHPSLSGGLAGLAMFFAYLEQTEPDQGHAEKAVEYLEASIQGMASQQMLPDLYAGFTGVTFCTEHLHSLILDAEGEDPNLEIDKTLKEHLGIKPWLFDYDLISGLVGMGMYALERMPRDIARECAERVVDRLEEGSMEMGPGKTWWTIPELLPEHQRKAAPEGYYNLGLAHGVPGVLGFLAGACKHGIVVEKARPLLEGGVRWILAQKIPDSPGARFAYAIHKGQEEDVQPSRLAWCYGDPGVVLSIYLAGMCLDNEEWKKEATDMALEMIQRPDDQSGVMDAGLCHGAAGLAHIYNRFYQWTGKEEFAAAARHWFEITLKMRKPGTGVGGFQSWSATPGSMDLAWQDDSGLLTGSTGIALALLAGIGEVQPNWDRFLLCSVPLGE